MHKLMLKTDLNVTIYLSTVADCLVGDNGILQYNSHSLAFPHRHKCMKMGKISAAN